VAPKSKVSVITLGCPKNVVDSEFLLGHLKKGDVQIVKSVDEADTIVINTCAFIQDAKQESIDAIIEAVERKKQQKLKKIVVMGCLPERYKVELKKEIPEVDSFFGTGQIESVVHDLDKDLKMKLNGERFLTTPSHYAYLKISEGCDNPCSFCAIPLMRGNHRSRPVSDLILEARSLADKGVRELIIVGQDTTYYGLDLYGERKLSELLFELDHIDGIEWIRLMYAYPAKFPMDIIEAFNRCRKLCRYIDIPIQHCSDNVLRSMRRGITKRATRELLEHLKSEIPGIAIRTTLLVGYPNETESDFNELYDFVGEMQFHRLGVFKYSQEEGTAAYDLGDPIYPGIKQERLDQLMELQMEISEKRNMSFIGNELNVLVDSKEGEFFVGRTEWDAPEIDQEVLIKTDRSLIPGTFSFVEVTNAAEYDLFASI
jgi:ribosomal protein S12 methylthiotransferase